MKKVNFKKLNAYCLSVTEKKNVTGGWWGQGPCLDCAPGYARVWSTPCPQTSAEITCVSCNSVNAQNYPECQWGIIIDEPIDWAEPEFP